MFTEFMNSLAQVERFDRGINSRELKIGEVELPSGATQLALSVPTGEVLTLEPRAQSQLLGQWDLPPAHFARLPRQLQAAELSHFSRSQPKDLTLRAVHEPAADGPVARAILSGRYAPFDSVEVLTAIEPAAAAAHRQDKRAVS